MYYWITPNAKGPDDRDLALSIDKNDPAGGLIVAYRTAGDKAQQWLPMIAPNRQAVLVNALSIEEGNPRVACSPKKSKRVTQAPLSSRTLNGETTWSLSERAIRPQRDHDLNLNVAGDRHHPGSEVIVWNWENGQPNEVWQFVPADF